MTIFLSYLPHPSSSGTTTSYLRKTLAQALLTSIHRGKPATRNSRLPPYCHVILSQSINRRFDIFHFLLQGGVGGPGGYTYVKPLILSIPRRRGAWRVHIFITLKTGYTRLMYYFCASVQKLLYFTVLLFFVMHLPEDDHG